ncbi:MAG: TlyA family RNA methyltransferase [Spirochaetes bacterium]|nr:TlyA family RNA methyltransferase [Spirochaetota bacterium]
MSERKKPLLLFLKHKYPEIEKKELYSKILCGEILINGDIVNNPHEHVSCSSSVVFKVKKNFVSRGGEKLEYILHAWKIDVTGETILDAGASTGGFTDCLLKHGALKVYAVDVGYNQLSFKLRKDSRVAVMERVNIMSLKREDFNPLPDSAVMDLSFRSVRKAAFHVLNLVKGKYIISLIKPQFELLNPDIGFNGVVKSREEVFAILKRLIKNLFGEGVYVHDIGKSPIPGRKGNREYFFKLSLNSGSTISDIREKLQFIVFEGFTG